MRNVKQGGASHDSAASIRSARKERIADSPIPADAKALADGDLDAANRVGPLTFSPYFAGPDWRSVWQRRVIQITDDPASAEWITRAVVDTDSGAVVGRAGFHGPPDATGMVEVGYAIDPAYRRKNYARAALVFLLKWAKSDPSIRSVRASIAPHNVASGSLVTQYGFVETGEQWDDEDGLEISFEVDAQRLPVRTISPGVDGGSATRPRS